MYLFDDFILSLLNINRKAFLYQIRFGTKTFVIVTMIVGNFLGFRWKMKK
ncbi:hypothetical protein A15O_00548 [Escherichia coli KTE207]|nr:hypothetical protein A15O_00548 [Escherichia coli KTE207]ELI66384.1 hypothetical protein WIW_04413 [Escherichia coli KTE133]